MSDDAERTQEPTGADARSASVVHQVREFFLLRDAEHAVSTYTPEQASELRTLHEAARRRIEAARQLDSALTRVSECVLLREALRYLDRARLLAAREEDLSAPSEGDPCADDPRILEGSSLAFDEQSPSELEATRARLVQAIGAARHGVEVRSPEFIRRTRFGRTAALAVVTLWFFWSVVGSAFRPTDIARDKPVAVSSQFPGTRDPSGLVDGDTGGTFGVHTKSEDSPWVMVDLQATYLIHTVKVYNRGDGWYDIGLPLVVEVSPDATHWLEVGRRTTHFDQSPPWQLDAIEHTGRFVRLRVAGRGIVSLSELEVFGRKQ